MKYLVELEYINIDNYSPFSYINEMSEQYRYDRYLLPYISHEWKTIPVHPDTISDLWILDSQILFHKEVYPTSSFRTVYLKEDNTFLKLPIQRKITRWLRDLPIKQILRSEFATELLKRNPLNGFSFLCEHWNIFKDEKFNYIVREIPNVKLYPLFYIIKSQKYKKDFLMKLITNIISTWMFYASRDIYLEYHTQNILVDKNANIYYRDLSDIKSFWVSIIQPSYANNLANRSELNSLMFDRSVCNQNLSFFLTYYKELSSEIPTIKQIIKSNIEKYALHFHNYSMDFTCDKPVRIPEKVPLNFWRN